jgi:hypothetical protein
MIDLLGRDLEEARRTLEAAGLALEVIETRAPLRVQLTGALRVVRQRLVGERTVQLVVTHERYEPGARATGA